MEVQLSLCSVIPQNKLRSVNQGGAQVQFMTSYANKEFCGKHLIWQMTQFDWANDAI